MTTQSLPISRTKKDYVQSTFVVLGIALISALSVYFTHPTKLERNATHKFIGIVIPNFKGIILRQPRMTIVYLIAIAMFILGFTFISREALSFFSRKVAWIFSVLFGLVALSIAFLNKAGTSSAWFRFFIMIFVLVISATVIAELMIFYRKFIVKKTFRTQIWHKIIFGLVCALLSSSIAFFYYHNAMKDGAVIDYGASSTIPNAKIPTIPTSTVPLNNITSSTQAP
ncbi:MAG: hypothetical protein U0R17_00540 [Acidimicrobiia bacterium]